MESLALFFVVVNAVVVVINAAVDHGLASSDGQAQLANAGRDHPHKTMQLCGNECGQWNAHIEKPQPWMVMVVEDIVTEDENDEIHSFATLIGSKHALTNSLIYRSKIEGQENTPKFKGYFGYTDIVKLNKERVTLDERMLFAVVDNFYVREVQRRKFQMNEVTLIVFKTEVRDPGVRPLCLPVEKFHVIDEDQLIIPVNKPNHEEPGVQKPHHVIFKEFETKLHWTDDSTHPATIRTYTQQAGSDEPLFLQLRSGERIVRGGAVVYKISGESYVMVGVLDQYDIEFEGIKRHLLGFLDINSPDVRKWIMAKAGAGLSICQPLTHHDVFFL